ncbi:MAG: acetolactate synthase small subunit [Eggerthellaceae bacterium]|nr:acetolactate synthase small subunit [Eggerthellaceae bacterium]
MAHILSILVDNRPGVLARVVGLVSRRGFNIDSLSVAPTEDPSLSRITMEATGDDVALEQITKQLHKLVNVVKITNLTKVNSVKRELVLIRVDCTPEQRAELTQIVEIFKAKVADVGATQLTLEVQGDDEKIEDFQRLLRPFGIREVVRSGRIAMARNIN